MRTCVVLAQLGTPDAPTAPAVRRYLREFLSDPRVVDLPRWLWLPILHGPVLTFRPAKTAKLYQSIWTDAGSPLLVHTLGLRDAVRERLPGVRVEAGMRYGNPSLRDLLTRLRDEVDRVVLVPLFPQYSEACNGSVLALAEEVLAGSGVEVHPVCSYHREPAWVDAVAATFGRHREEHGEPDLWLMTFHGIPQRQARRGDPYQTHCQESAAAIAAAAGLPDGRWRVTFQSRFGPGAWLQPYTDKTLMELGREGVGSLAVACPGFAADCLETVDEIAEIGREQFRSEGGGEMHTLPCLNADPAWADALAGMVGPALSGDHNACQGPRASAILDSASPAPETSCPASSFSSCPWRQSSRGRAS